VKKNSRNINKNEKIIKKNLEKFLKMKKILEKINIKKIN